MLEAIDLTKRYEDGQLALDALYLDIKPGEVFFLLGANGAGKTTTINLFLNFIEPSGGKALVDGIDVMENPLETKRLISYVSENVMLYGNFTARQNLDFFSKLAGKTGLNRQDYYETMHSVGLQEEAFEKKLKTFSKGMRQKVGLAIAMIKDAPNILLDEPTSGLDPRSAAELMQMLMTLRTRGKSILMCTHDIFRAKSVADRVGIMKEGRLAMIRTREEFLLDDLERIYLEYMQEAVMYAETVN
jgi:ABC-2 type transport system ATP-binding protein